MLWVLTLGQTPIKQRLEEIESAVASGATEIDIVISRAFVLEGKWQALYSEVQAMRKACRGAHLKTIIATGALLLIHCMLSEVIRLLDDRCKREYCFNYTSTCIPNLPGCHFQITHLIYILAL